MKNKGNGLKEIAPKGLLRIAQILLGLTFIFSGFVKAVDPLGTTYKIEDYLSAFAEMGGALAPLFENAMVLATVAAFVLIAFEFTLGVMLVANVWRKLTSWLTLAFMCCVTPLTLWIALTNPVSDCGCFGDALVLTNWQTFWKNIVLLALAIAIVWGGRKAERRKGGEAERLTQGLIAGGAAVIVILFMVWTLYHLPVIDFRPYKIGNNIPEQMEIPEGAEVDQYEIRLVYADENGKEQEFTLQDYPKDSTWHFVRQNSKLIKKGYVPPIHDFELMNMDYEDITWDILESETPVTLVVMYDLDKTNLKQMEKVTQLYYQCLNNQEPFYILTGASDARIEEFCYQVEQQYNTLDGRASNRLTPFNHWESVFCTADPVMLKTIVRANPGVIVVQNGNVIDKYNIRNK